MPFPNVLMFFGMPKSNKQVGRVEILAVESFYKKRGFPPKKRVGSGHPREDLEQNSLPIAWDLRPKY